ncbi:excalibur calcium-binding domain-containing protein [Auraticoccus cholistanensis]|uniref:excalibur calcium-binding domain-containing protein n=1 Tax=Auraticoccus cholistanensis TaxID=2656650 RepID=UPI002F90D473
MTSTATETATVTAPPEPAETIYQVTEKTVTAEPEPAPTVTETVYRAAAPDTTDDEVGSAPDAADDTYYENCDAARAAGAAPVRTGDPGYGRHLDRDGDGVGCES